MSVRSTIFNVVSSIAGLWYEVLYRCGSEGNKNIVVD
jgi:hypothetical protein